MKCLIASLVLVFASFYVADAQDAPILCEASSDASLAGDGSSTIAVPHPQSTQSAYLCGWTIWPNMQAQNMDVDVFFGASGGTCEVSERPSPAGSGVLVTT